MAGPKLVTLELTAYMLDGAELTVRALNIDMVSWERDAWKHKWPPREEAPYIALNYLAWHALNREGRFAGTLREFEEAAAQITSSSPNGDEELEVDPTSRAAEPA